MIPWTDSVKQSGKLTVHIGALTGSWGHVVREALHEFNTLSSANKLGVKMVESKDGPDKANIVVQTARGPISATYDQETRKEDFSANRLHGRTMPFFRDPPHEIEKVFTFLPSQPLLSAPGGWRPAGPGVLKVIAVHELVHACGLEDSDHGSNLFQGSPGYYPGDTPAGDKITIKGSSQRMPPLLLDGATVGKIKELWS